MEALSFERLINHSTWPWGTACFCEFKTIVKVSTSRGRPPCRRSRVPGELTPCHRRRLCYQPSTQVSRVSDLCLQWSEWAYRWRELAMLWPARATRVRSWRSFVWASLPLSLPVPGD